MNAKLKFLVLGLMAIGVSACANGAPKVLYDFHGTGVPVGITAIGSADLFQSHGRLFVRTPADGDGIRIEVPAKYNCVAIQDVLLNDVRPGKTMLWKWVVQDSSGSKFPLLESSWILNDIDIHTEKKDKNGNTVSVNRVFPIKEINELSPFTTSWDRRTVNGVEQVQLEFRDPRTKQFKKLLPWQDPLPTTTVAFEITTTLPGFSIGQIGVSPEHVEVEADFKEFSSQVFVDRLVE